ncbi:MAG TPA: hypothetical protein PKD54_14980 [Pirellulaceae bacterium]|nr:hypothetical protein [Pirellulaceae bacterium]
MKSRTAAILISAFVAQWLALHCLHACQDSSTDEPTVALAICEESKSEKSSCEWLPDQDCDATTEFVLIDDDMMGAVIETIAHHQFMYFTAIMSSRGPPA